jgi:MAF protein
VAARAADDIMGGMEILLASQSPRRFEILSAHGVRPVVVPPDADESLPAGVSAAGPESIVKYLSVKKALSVLERVGRCDCAPRGGANPGARAAGSAGGVARGDELPQVLVAADTIVWCDRLIGKPKDARDAFGILSSYRNRTHEVWTGVTLIERCSGKEDTFAVCTRVTMGDYSDDDIWSYIADEKPFDKSGSYAIQSRWGDHITSVEGDFENVIGFPWPVVKEHLIPMLKELARRVLPARTGEWADRIGVRPTKISVGNARKRWGSCKTDGSIRYTWRIMLGDDRVMDYLIVHELAHLKNMNHSKRYWSVVESVLPDYKQRRKELRALYKSIEEEGWG